MYTTEGAMPMHIKSRKMNIISKRKTSLKLGPESQGPGVVVDMVSHEGGDEVV